MDAHLQQYNVQPPNYHFAKNIIISETDKIMELKRFIIGEKFISQLMDQDIIDIAKSDLSVLLEGETGTGKLLVAETIHKISDKKDRLFVDFNLAEIDQGTANSELFGSCKGGFTEVEEREGVFEQADGGTLSIDEIGDADLGVQKKLLKAIEKKVIRRVSARKHKPDDKCSQGAADHTSIKVDIRIIVATNKNLQEEIKEGRFKDDLYYRLNECKITLPSLRERKEDIPLLVSHFIKKHKEKVRKNIEGISRETLKIFMEYNWSGNVRELEATIKSAMVHCKSNIIIPDCLIGTNILNTIPSSLENRAINSRQKIEEFLVGMKPNERITNKEIRERFNVSPMTFNRIMKNLRSQGIFQLIGSCNVQSSYYIRV